MRYLNRIIFINSANIPYSEIDIDGNVHLIGDQGSGKSTLLRAILFFYNGSKTKLGIPREKKGFDDYYFAYQNSYIIYEVIKGGIPFCVLAYKVNGKVAFRFFDSAYRREFFLDENNRALESWEKIRNAFGKEVYSSALVTSYEEFRKIIYGDNKGLAPGFRKYALIESRQYQNIPRTIQNVFLNSNLEAKFIKDTIINSLDEDEFELDIQNYSQNHLRDFENQIEDIKIWFKENRKGQIPIRNQANRVIEKFRVFNFLSREKKELTRKLAARMRYIEEQRPLVLSDYSRESDELRSVLKQKENLTETHKRREQNLISKIDYHKRELLRAKDKQKEYENLQIEAIIEKVSEKEGLTKEEKLLNEEKILLTSQFSEITQKYAALISQAHNQQQEFSNNKQSEITAIKIQFLDTKEALFDSYQKIINQIIQDNETEKEKADQVLNEIHEKENRVKNKKAALKYQVFFADEIEKNKEEKRQLEGLLSKAEIEILNSKNLMATSRREWELDAKSIESTLNGPIEKELERSQQLYDKIQRIEKKIEQSQSSFYGWLNENYPGWEHSIGKVVDEEKVLFNSELAPRLLNNQSTSFFGVELDLHALVNPTKSIKDYHQEIEEYRKQIAAIQSRIDELTAKKEEDLQKLRSKFNKRLKELKDSIAENEYRLSQGAGKLKKNKVDFEEWTRKAQLEKEQISQSLEEEMEKLASEKQHARAHLDIILSGIKRKISLKEKERNTEIKKAEQKMNENIRFIQLAISENKNHSDVRIQEFRNQQRLELDHKGANTKRLTEVESRLSAIRAALEYIKDNERTVIEYEKDKRELFDKVPFLRADKTSLEKKQTTILDEHKVEQDKMSDKCAKQETKVKSIKHLLDQFEADQFEFEEFKKSDVFLSIGLYFSMDTEEIEASKLALSIIGDIKSKHYSGIDTFKELQQATHAFVGNFNEKNIFSFKVKLNEDQEYLSFAADLVEFIEEEKIKEYEKRVNERFASIIHLIGRETTELNSKEAEIEKIIKKINDDFRSKNFVQAIKEMEMRTQKSSNPIVKILIEIKEFNDENGMVLGETNLFTSSDSNASNKKAVDLLKQLVKELERTKSSTLTLSESFDLQFRIVENDNDSGWVEKLSNVGSEGTDVLVKAMVNILLLNVFKDNASRKFKDFKLHCMMDEIGRLHPNNVKGILRFANERNILLINGSPTSQNAMDYKYTYRLAKEQSSTDKKRFITRVNRLVKVNAKVLNE